MYKALELPLQIDLRDWSNYLRQQGLTHLITEASGQQIVWVRHEEDISTVVDFYQQWQSGAFTLLRQSNSSQPAKHWTKKLYDMLFFVPWHHFPITTFFILASVCVYITAHLLGAWLVVEPLAFVPMDFSYGQLFYGTIEMTLSEGDYWRLLSPILLHFSLSHLVFNMLSLYIFASRLEVRQGHLHILGIILFTGILSNTTQYYFSDQTTLFGGMSGVVYGLMGYCFMREQIDKHWFFGLPTVYYGIMCVWLLIGFTDFTGFLGLGSMANAAHTSGLLAGGLLGAITGVLFKEPTPAQ